MQSHDHFKNYRPFTQQILQTFYISLLYATGNHYNSLRSQTMQSCQKTEVVPSPHYKPDRVNFTEGFPPARPWKS